MLKSEKKQADTHRLNILNFTDDHSHAFADDLVVVHQVQPQKVIVDQPQRHVTCKLGRFLDQLNNLVGCELVQFVPIVHCGAHIRVRLAGGQKNTAPVEKRRQVGMQNRSMGNVSCLKKGSNATTYLVGGESEREGGNAREGEERVRSTIHTDGLQTGNRKENLFGCSFSERLQRFAHTRRGWKHTDRPQLTHLHVCFPVAPCILSEETLLAVWNFHLEEGEMN